jgi:hypothetical protein
VIKSYSRAAAAARAELLPAGVAWQLAWRCSAGVPLYGQDDFHPSPTGRGREVLELVAQGLSG